MKPWKNDKAERLTLFLTQIKILRNFKVALDAVYLLLATIFWGSTTSGCFGLLASYAVMEITLLLWQLVMGRKIV